MYHFGRQKCQVWVNGQNMLTHQPQNIYTLIQIVYSQIKKKKITPLIIFLHGVLIPQDAKNYSQLEGILKPDEKKNLLQGR